MERFVYKGEFNMNNYLIMFENKSILDLKQTCYLDSLYNLFEEKIQYVTKTLKNNNIEEDEWDIQFIKEDALQSIKNIEEDFITDKTLDWRINLSKIIKKVLDKSKANFKIADEMYHNPMKKSEQYYDLLSNIFDNLEELICIKYKEYEISRNIRFTNIGNLVNNDNSSNYIDNEHIEFDFNFKFEIEDYDNDDYALAA